MIASITDIAHQLYVDPSRRAELMRIIKEEGLVKNFEIIMRRKDGSLIWVSMDSHGIRGINGDIIYHEGTLQDITSRKFAEEELKQLRTTLAGTIRAMSLTVEMRDPGTRGHQKRVSHLAAAIAREMGFPDAMAEGITTAGIIHDIGKISVPGEILSKPAGLTGLEHALVKVHPQSGYDILKEAGLPHPVAETVLQHHERLNGSGYPQGLRGSEILLEARILAVADVVEAISSPRPYRPALGMEAALQEIQQNRGILYDAEVVSACLKLFREKGYQL